MALPTMCRLPAATPVSRAAALAQHRVGLGRAIPGNDVERLVGPERRRPARTADRAAPGRSASLRWRGSRGADELMLLERVRLVLAAAAIRRLQPLPVWVWKNDSTRSRSPACDRDRGAQRRLPERSAVAAAAAAQSQKRPPAHALLWHLHHGPHPPASATIGPHWPRHSELSVLVNSVILVMVSNAGHDFRLSSPTKDCSPSAHGSFRMRRNPLSRIGDIVALAWFSVSARGHCSRQRGLVICRGPRRSADDFQWHGAVAPGRHARDQGRQWRRRGAERVRQQRGRAVDGQADGTAEQSRGRADRGRASMPAA